MKNKSIVGSEKVAVIYARYSSNNQREESIDAQVRACKAYAESKGYNIIKIYTDSAMSATNDNRPEFQSMIADAKKKLFQFVIIHKLDRFSRDKYDAVTYKRELKISGVTLLSVTENIDGSPESMIFESLLEGLAQYYSANLAREVMKGLKENAYQCKHTGGFAALGYDVDPVTKKYVINEEEAKIIRIIFDMYSKDVGYNQILEYLNSMGYKTKFGNSFAKNSLNTILKNPKYIGTYIYNQKKEKDATGKRNAKIKPRDEWIVIEGGIPAIIDKDTFNTVQLKIAHNADKGGRYKAKEIYLLSGLIYCGECGSSMYGNSRMCGRNKSKYTSYRCSSRQNHQGCKNKELRKEYLENFVLDELYNNLFSVSSIQKLSKMLAEYHNKQADNNREELNTATIELKNVITKIRSVIRLVSETEISIDTVKEELKELEDKKLFLEKHIKELSLYDRESKISEEMIINLINQSKDFVKTKNLAECRHFINTYINKVLVYNDKVEVLFNINIPNENVNAVEQLKSVETIPVLQRDYKAI